MIQSKRFSNVDSVIDDIKMSEGSSLWQAGGTASELNICDIIKAHVLVSFF
jgi:hypothetical protein